MKEDKNYFCYCCGKVQSKNNKFCCKCGAPVEADMCIMPKKPKTGEMLEEAANANRYNLLNTVEIEGCIDTSENRVTTEEFREKFLEWCEGNKWALMPMRYTKEQLKNAMYLLLDETLSNIHCKKIEKEGNWDCHRCDDCMFEQYVLRIKLGELPRKLTGK